MSLRRGTPALAIGLLGVLAGGKCRPAALPAGGLVLTQIPAAAEPPSPKTILDARYPVGSRVVYAPPPLDPKTVRVLSAGLVAAGEPFTSADAGRILFSGKKTADSDWQVYETGLAGGEPRALTSLPGGASSPTLLADGSVVFVSPVPMRAEGWFPKVPAAIRSLSPAGGTPARLTFGTSSVADPTVLADGRILFVSALPPEGAPRLSLSAIYSDGTGILPYAAQHDGTTPIARPRELAGGRIAFLSDVDSESGDGLPESVLSARPWRSRGELFSANAMRSRSLEPDGGSVLASLPGAASWAIHRLAPGESTTEVLFDDPAWNEVEAVRASPRKKPAGRISTIIPAKKTGLIFCQDVKHSTQGSASPAVRVRILVGGGGPGGRPLGELPVQPDGSFLAEVPADVPLGFETLDAEGKLLQRLMPSIWVRPGENRGCIGCHEPHGVAPRNHRPLAVKQAPVKIEPSAAAPGGRSYTQ